MVREEVSYAMFQRGQSLLVQIPLRQGPQVAGIVMLRRRDSRERKLILKWCRCAAFSDGVSTLLTIAVLMTIVTIVHVRGTGFVCHVGAPGGPPGGVATG